jgi:SAM-dependent methyltransferase
VQSPQFQLHAEIEQRHWWFVGRRRIMRRLAEAVVPPSKQSLVVDVGCGTGANLAALADAYDCLGIDTSAEAVALAQQRFPAVQFVAGFAPDDLGDRMARARLVLLMDVLEHIEDDFTILSKLLSAASPGCHFLITVPADEGLWSRHDESFGHYRRYDRERLEAVWQGLPVVCRMVSHFNARLLPLIRWVRVRNQRRGAAAGTAGTDFWLPPRPVNWLLTRAFSGESGRLAGLLGEMPGRTAYRAGASLVAILRREPGVCAIREKPPGLPPDHRPR